MNRPTYSKRSKDKEKNVTRAWKDCRQIYDMFQQTWKIQKCLPHFKLFSESGK